MHNSYQWVNLEEYTICADTSAPNVVFAFHLLNITQEWIDDEGRNDIQQGFRILRSRSSTPNERAHKCSPQIMGTLCVDEPLCGMRPSILSTLLSTASRHSLDDFIIGNGFALFEMLACTGECAHLRR